MVNPRLAAALNIIPLGFGYLYLKSYGRFAATVVLAMILGFVGFIGTTLFAFAVIDIDKLCKRADIFACSELTRKGTVIAYLIGLAPLLALAAYTAQDAWRLAVRHDKRLLAPEDVLPDMTRRRSLVGRRAPIICIALVIVAVGLPILLMAGFLSLTR